jgi:hypothetical protein
VIIAVSGQRVDRREKAGIIWLRCTRSWRISPMQEGRSVKSEEESGTKRDAEPVRNWFVAKPLTGDARSV